MTATFPSLRRRSLLAAAGALAIGGSRHAAAGAIAPRRGGHLLLGIDKASTPARLDPAPYPEIYSYIVGMQIFNTLTEIGDDGAPVPSLAESWESRNAATEWVFRLRRGVTFHNGKQLTVSDVIWSLNHHRGDKSKSAAKAYLEPVTELRESAPGELSIVLRSGNADLPTLLADVHLGIGPDGEDFDKGIGTGAFVLEDFQPGVRTLTRRNPNYWNSARGHVDSVETIALNDTTARIAALLSGKVHIINHVEPRLLERVSAAPNVNVVRTKDAAIYTFAGLADQAPFGHPEVRQALKYAIDRQQVLNAVLAGVGSVANDQPIVPSNRYFAADIPARPYDPDKARFHWKRAGYDGCLLYSSPSPRD